MSDALIELLGSFRGDLLRFARLQLRDEAAAEDAVQEALLSAIEGADRFSGRSQVKTWVFSILRNKIIDMIRRRAREPNAGGLNQEIPGDAFDALFDAQGHWQPAERPTDWGDPEQSLEDAQFWQVFDACLHRLPENTARVFMMRELLGFETHEICKELTMTSSSCWVVLHRARMALRICLDNRWFQGKK
ncbi:sigma-70 family RNA polymerase sigma factor [Denitratisoma oestradiolicum]|uniref:Putative RNA polymerase sigma factor HI_1459 n=1 Tax=Denitratisoma oestradiolicum TaxID=311182 RepID=A0A6S6Y0T0_9PROT|nr:sigma-70 family RNA polymerase sigma factor [Denitratisoma oestradiolicum]TWO81908.1 RNA polymerase subunit sigma [Denitratisoma oestradiolicum]CAB1368799.1 putative RNA polymerase sigma factor HI_1459 [Denitratisoma oestradiolicum]